MRKARMVLFAFAATAPILMGNFCANPKTDCKVGRYIANEADQARGITSTSTCSDAVNWYNAGMCSKKILDEVRDALACDSDLRGAVKSINTPAVCSKEAGTTLFWRLAACVTGKDLEGVGAKGKDVCFVLTAKDVVATGDVFYYWSGGSTCFASQVGPGGPCESCG